MFLRIILWVIAIALIARLIAYFFFDESTADKVVDFIWDVRQIAVVLVIIALISLAFN